MIEPSGRVGSGTWEVAVFAVVTVVLIVDDAKQFADAMEAKALESVECAAGPGGAFAHKYSCFASMTCQLK